MLKTNNFLSKFGYHQEKKKKFSKNKILKSFQKTFHPVIDVWTGKKNRSKHKICHQNSSFSNYKEIALKENLLKFFLILIESKYFK